MRITLVQAEIELAIRRYIGSQLTVANGTKMVIDLKATRGEEGFMAQVDIFPASEGPNFTKEIPADKAPASNVFDLNKPKTVAALSPMILGQGEGTASASTPQQEPEKPDNAAAASDAAQAQSDDQVSAAADTGSNETTAATGTDSSTGATTPATAPKGRSLFSGMHKPKN